ncbi:response regulator [candidate division KSB1 bacterium]|nr:response regulator [candidate division KSB1 bacterium]
MNRILVANTSVAFQRKIAPVEKENNFKFIFAQNGIEGLELLRKNRIQVVISHLVNSLIDDIELMLNIHEIKPQIPVIIIVSKSSDVRKEQYIKAGAFACIDEGDSISKIRKYINLALIKN